MASVQEYIDWSQTTPMIDLCTKIEKHVSS